MASQKFSLQEEVEVKRAQGAQPGLKQDALSHSEVLAQSIANIAPTATPAIVVPLVFASAGNGTWLSYLIATVGLLLISFNINQFARRSSSAGSLYTYIGQGFGSSVGVIAGWALVLAYLFTASAVILGFANYANVLLGTSNSLPVTIGLALSGIFAAWFVAYRDIRLSTKLILVLELLSVALIFVLALVVLRHYGFHIDRAQLSLKNVSFDNLRLGLVLAVFSFVGFESATALGEEAKSPLRTIPRSVFTSVAVVGFLFVFFSYIEVLGFRGLKEPLDKSAAPLNTLAQAVGLPFFGKLISAGAAISFFACTLASLNAGARILYALGRHGVLHERVGRAHKTNETPHIAVTLTAALIFLVPVILLLRHIDILDAYGYLGTLATFGFLLNYVLIAAAAPLYLKRLGQLKWTHIVASVAAIAFILIPVVGSVYPAPATPYNILPFVFLALLAVGVIWLVFLRARSPELVRQIERDLHLSRNNASDATQTT